MRLAITIPNTLSFMRILAAPAIVLIALSNGSHNLLTVLLLFLASVTDFFDGYLARKLNLASPSGAFLDPLSDKVLVLGGFLSLCFLGKIGILVPIIILLRDVGVTLLRSIALSKNLPFATSQAAKFKTAFQLISLHVLFLIFSYKTVPTSLETISSLLVYGVAIFTIWTGVSYLIPYLRKYRF